MYASAFVLGFHGCDKAVGEKILRGRQPIGTSENEHDWLGEGAYFWENSPTRALQWAQFIQAHPDWFSTRIKTPFVVGAIIDLGHCLDLTEAGSLGIVRAAFDEMKIVFGAAGIPLPENEKGHSRDEDLIKRKRDCAVINYLHVAREARFIHAGGNEPNHRPYDTVRGAFFEGKPLYEGAGIMAQTHIQLAVRHPAASIRGYFRPLPESE
ncbi:MAG: hypothetical protein ACREH8_08050 [Opitutaceae bacterium]